MAQEKRLKERMGRVKHKIMVMSGKGGVGKTTVSVNLALTLAAKGYEVGILDADIHGPNIPKMLGIEDERPDISEDGISPVFVRRLAVGFSLAILIAFACIGGWYLTLDGFAGEALQSATQADWNRIRTAVADTEYFYLKAVSASANADIVDSTGLGTIIDNEYHVVSSVDAAMNDGTITPLGLEVIERGSDSSNYTITADADFCIADVQQS